MNEEKWRRMQNMKENGEYEEDWRLMKNNEEESR